MINESNEAQSAKRNANTHERTMNEPRARKSPAAASAAVTSDASPHPGATIDASVSLSTTTSNLEPRLENVAAIKHWVASRIIYAQLPDSLPVTNKGLEEWIMNCATELANLLTSLPYPCDFSNL